MRFVTKQSLTVCLSMFSLAVTLLSPMQTAWAKQAIRVGDPLSFSKSTPEKILLLGSSVADGWKDTVGGGYLMRTLRYLQHRDHTTFDVINRTVPGQGALKLSGQIPGWIQEAHPSIVVIAWGGLDDAYAHTPMPIFRALIAQEIQLSIAMNAKVFVITPPISKASYTQFLVQQPQYLDAEMQVARQMKNPNVYVFDVFDQMKRVLQRHHETYVPFMADGWHPNTRGHALAARLLIHDINQFVQTPSIS